MRNSAQRGPKPRPQFKLTTRGYDPHEVEAFLAQLSDDLDLPVPGFGRVMRGYDPEQVDLHIEHVKALGSSRADSSAEGVPSCAVTGTPRHLFELTSKRRRGSLYRDEG